MKKWSAILLISIGALGFISLQLSNYALDSSLSEWNEGVNGYVSSIRSQQKNAKPIAALFYTDWCPNCKRLREDILSTPEFRQYAEKNLNVVKINPEMGEMENKLAEDFGVLGYPSLFIISADDENSVAIRKTSHISVNQFIEQIDRAIDF